MGPYHSHILISGGTTMTGITATFPLLCIRSHALGEAVEGGMSAPLTPATPGRRVGFR
jgi:hypothetical protein